LGGARPVSIRFLNHRISGLSSTINGFITSLLQMVFCLCRITVERIAPGIEAPPYFAIRGSPHFYGWEYLWASKKNRSSQLSEPRGRRQENLCFQRSLLKRSPRRLENLRGIFLNEKWKTANGLALQRPILVVSFIFCLDSP